LKDQDVRLPRHLYCALRASGIPRAERFLTELTLDPPDATSVQAGVPLLDEDYLILSTIHSAKGQEWKSVYLLNVVDGCMPSDLGAGNCCRLRSRKNVVLCAGPWHISGDVFPRSQPTCQHRGQMACSRRHIEQID